MASFHPNLTLVQSRFMHVFHLEVKKKKKLVSTYFVNLDLTSASVFFDRNSVKYGKLLIAVYMMFRFGIDICQYAWHRVEVPVQVEILSLKFEFQFDIMGKPSFIGILYSFFVWLCKSNILIKVKMQFTRGTGAEDKHDMSYFGTTPNCIRSIIKLFMKYDFATYIFNQSLSILYSISALLHII